MKGNPYFCYKIPYDDWYIIVTDQGEHFYFNKSKEESYWQLHDVFESHQELSKEKFVNSINFDDVSIMMAKSNGLKGVEDFYLIQEDQEKDDVNTDNENVEQTSEKTENETEGEGIPNIEDENSSGNGIIALEGANEQSEPGKGIGLFSGYSSSSDSENDEDQVIEEKGDNFGLVAAEGIESEESEDDETVANNEGLDLLLSEDEDEEKNKAEFFKLLDNYSDKILIYEPWFIVEEELLADFSKNPEYFSVASPTQKETFFNEWCSTKQQDTKTSESELRPISIYPSVSQNYYRFLQNNKGQVKKLHYNEFKARHQEFMDSEFPDIASNEKEDMYRRYRVMIIDYPEYEKRMKKSHPDANCKKLKLDSFLRENLSSEFNRDVSKETIYEIEHSSQDDFHKWAKLCDIYLVPRAIANNVNNFILGDEKRLASYVELFREFHS